MEFQVRYLALFCLFTLIDSFKWFRMGSSHKNIQLMLEFLMAPFLVPHFYHNRLMTYLTYLIMLSVILPSILMILLCSKCNQASDVWQQLELASELESDLQNIVDWGRRWLVDFSAGKTHLVLLDKSNNTGAIDVEMDRSVFE